MLELALARLAILALPLDAQVLDTSYTLPNGDRVLRHEAVMHPPQARVWKAFTTPEEMRHLIAPVVAIDLRPGGIWESSYDPDRKIGMPASRACR